MKLVRVEVKNFRSIGDLDVALVDGMNSFVGPNNCGKSNLVGAMRMALDPDYQFDPTRDVPGQRHFAFPRTTLTFKCVGANSPYRNLIIYLNVY
jgi:predicted ATP-dependent endonuclease of OLD family